MQGWAGFFATSVNDGLTKLVGQVVGGAGKVLNEAIQSS